LMLVPIALHRMAVSLWRRFLNVHTLRVRANASVHSKGDSRLPRGR
jgi:hypothetical protein